MEQIEQEKEEEEEVEEKRPITEWELGCCEQKHGSRPYQSAVSSSRLPSTPLPCTRSATVAAGCAARETAGEKCRRGSGLPRPPQADCLHGRRCSRLAAACERQAQHAVQRLAQAQAPRAHGHREQACGVWSFARCPAAARASGGAVETSGGAVETSAGAAAPSHCSVAAGLHLPGCRPLSAACDAAAVDAAPRVWSPPG